jgi:DNA-binding transcriptional LysR family regulator
MLRWPKCSNPTSPGQCGSGCRRFCHGPFAGVLAAFAEAHPLVELEVTCDLTLNLVERFHAGDFDLALVKRQPAQERQDGVRCARTAGLGGARTGRPWQTKCACRWSFRLNHASIANAPLKRSSAIGRPWRIAYTSTSLAGSLQPCGQAGHHRAAAGMVHRLMVAVGGAGARRGQLPPLYDTKCLDRSAGPVRYRASAAQHIIAALERGA